MNFDRIFDEMLVIAKLFVFKIPFAKIFVRQEQILAAALKINIFSEKNLFARKQEEIGDFRGKRIQKVFAEKEARRFSRKRNFIQISQTWTNFMYFKYCFQSL
jgi:hypothetical protein